MNNAGCRSAISHNEKGLAFRGGIWKIER